MRKRTTIAKFPMEDKIHIFFFKGRWRIASLSGSNPKPIHVYAAVRFCQRVNREEPFSWNKS